MEKFIKVQLADGSEAIINKSTITKITANQKGNLTILFNGMGGSNLPLSIEVGYAMDYLLKILNE